ncbi:MAG: alpha/beta hydrolase [Anaerolineae bacterium]|nr:alpha/beta hydrolase [Anaerolineae bacterium]
MKKSPLHSILKKVGRVMAMALSILLALILIFVGVLLWYSPGKINPVVDQNGNPVPGSISEKIWVDINGLKQGMFIQSRDPNNPVLLFMHGGPGMPEYFLTEQYPTGLENDFTMVWWDQRGAGLSYSPNIPPETMTVEQYISDAIAVTHYLRDRFHKDKIYLMAHSGGSFFAIQTAQRAPELFAAYIGVGQIVYQVKSEKIAYEYMLAEYQARDDTNMVNQLKAAPPTMTMPQPAAYDRLRDNAMHGVGVGTTREMKTVEGGVFFPSWFSKQLTLKEKINLWRGKIFAASMLRNEVFSTDLSQKVAKLEIPVYFFSGKYDYTVNHEMSKAYLAELQAPVKGFYTFENSAHSPFFEKPDRVRMILREDVLQGTANLADKP